MKEDVNINLVVGEGAWKVGERWRRRRSQEISYSDLHSCMHA